ncbi:MULTISPECIES: hypothetical protein [unclassified Archaeoglobus]|jgi:hypothetical protein|uniref:hypothetical protein n=1 Tax=unclassified Archaeoglobus TaxID=2643606 RepID=UPI0025C593FC|nr:MULTISPECIES: hypothetical protein [unclassified Archaeoglobus]
MDELEVTLEELVKEVRKRDTIAALLISTAFMLFGFLALVLLDVIRLSEFIKGMVAIVTLIVTWLMMTAGVYILLSMPLPELPTRIVADSKGVMELMKRNYGGKVYVTRQNYRNLPPKVGAMMNLEVVDVPSEEVKKYLSHGMELAESIVAAKNLRAKVVSDVKKKIDGVEVIRAEDLF